MVKRVSPRLARAATARVTRDDAGPHGDLAIKLPYPVAHHLSPLRSVVPREEEEEEEGFLRSLHELHPSP